MAETIVYLLRHGATAANREVPYRLLGRSLDLPLDEEGAEQARRAGKALRRHRLAAVYTSPMLRAVETAARVAWPHGLEPVVVEGVIEADLGRWEGLTWDQARAADPEHHEAFLAHPGTVPYPGGESFRDAQDRMVPTIAELVSRHPGERIAVVSHNVTNRAYLAGLMGMPIDRAREIRQANGGISVIRYQPPAAAVVETVNAAFHLARPD
ncbi:MAG TPA: histidine phosphatase family protein [Isosphaeraceae bacterium]|jgi:broad specificity phosphatase PhoE